MVKLEQCAAIFLKSAPLTNSKAFSKLPRGSEKHFFKKESENFRSQVERQ